jgi:hypothetical protein
MPKSPIELIAEAVRFYSDQYEVNFFAWARKIATVRNVRGEGRAIIIECDPPPIADEALRELTALFFRYGVETKQLDAFLTDANRAWFADERAYWRRTSKLAWQATTTGWAT